MELVVFEICIERESTLIVGRIDKSCVNVFLSFSKVLVKGFEPS